MWHEDQTCCSLIQRHQGFLDLPFARNSPSPPSTRQQDGNSLPLSSLLSSSPNGRGRAKQQNTEKGTSLCFLGFQFYYDEPRGKSKLLVKDLKKHRWVDWNSIQTLLTRCTACTATQRSGCGCKGWEVGVCWAIQFCQALSDGFSLLNHNLTNTEHLPVPSASWPNSF